MKGIKGFSPGESGNPNGRPPGAINRVTGNLRANIVEFLENHFDEIVTEWSKSQGRDKMSFYRELLSFAIPKLTNVSQDQATVKESEFAELSDEQINTIVNKLIDEYGKRKKA